MPNCPHCDLPFINLSNHIRSCRQRQQNERDAFLTREIELKNENTRLSRQLEERKAQQQTEEKKHEFIMEQPPDLEFYNPLRYIMTSYNTLEHLLLIINGFISGSIGSLSSIENVNTRDEIIMRMANIIADTAKPCHKQLISKIGQKLGEPRLYGINWHGLHNLVTPTETEKHLIRFCDYIGSYQQTYQQLCVKLAPHISSMHAIIVDQHDQDCFKHFIRAICIDRQNLPQQFRLAN